jgi:hypothetical protein
LGGGHPATRHYFAAPDLKNPLTSRGTKCESECAKEVNKFDGGDQRDEAARAGLTVDEFQEWGELKVLGW